MGKITIVSKTYENVAIQIKIGLPYFSWAFSPSCVVFEPIYGHFICFSSTSLLSLYILSQGWVLRRSSRSDPPKENGRKFAPEAPVASKFRVDHGRQLLFPSVVFVRVEFSQRPNKTSAISEKFPVLSRRQRLYSNSALPKRSKVSLATRPDTQITSTPGGRQSFAPVGKIGEFYAHH